MEDCGVLGVATKLVWHVPKASLNTLGYPWLSKDTSDMVFSNLLVLVTPTRECCSLLTISDLSFLQQIEAPLDTRHQAVSSKIFDVRCRSL